MKVEKSLAKGPTPSFGHARTDWSDGTKLYVNYNKAPVTVEGVAVPAENWTEVRP